MSANGRIVTGFSKPYVALYQNTDGTVSYTSGKILARGVSVSLSIETGGENKFYADNGQAETAGGTFTGGTATLVVDGMLPDAETLVLGLPEPTELMVDESPVNIVDYDETMKVPYVGIGYITRYMSDGVTSYVPTMLTKAKIHTPNDSAETQGEEIAWQQQTLTVDLMRDDSPNRKWKRVAEAQETEAKAEAVLKTMLGIVGV